MEATPPPDAGLKVLTEFFHAELRRIAQLERRRGMPASETLRTTALVNEAYLKLVRQRVFNNRSHFLATAALAMRQVLVGHARRRLADKRGGGTAAQPLEAADGVLAEDAGRILALDEALTRLAQLNPRYAKVVECRYFAGLSEPETAEALGVTERTVQRDWVKAKALLYETLEPG